MGYGSGRLYQLRRRTQYAFLTFSSRPGTRPRCVPTPPRRTPWVPSPRGPGPGDVGPGHRGVVDGTVDEPEAQFQRDAVFYPQFVSEAAAQARAANSDVLVEPPGPPGHATGQIAAGGPAQVRDRICALGFTQYEPKPAGRGPVARRHP